MYQNSKEIKPLDWQKLVDEALRRRKAEKITQREHAALANVSIPTMADFERGEKSLTLAKAFDILRVVGLVNEATKVEAQNIFVRNAFERWCEITSSLKENEPACFPHGYFRFDYYLAGVDRLTLEEFYNVVQQSSGTSYHNASLWTCEDKSRIKIQESYSAIECWQPDQGMACRDFWYGSPNGQMFLMRGYHEDHNDCGYEGVPAGTIIDPTIHVRRMVQALVHAKNLASYMSKRDDITVHFRSLYTGLSGRVLRSIFDNSLTGNHAARGNEIILEISLPIKNINGNLSDYIYPLALTFYEKFGAKISINLFQDLVKLVPFSKPKFVN